MRININVFGRGAILDFELYNLFMPNGLLYHNSSDQFTSNKRGVWLVYIIITTIFIAIPVLNAITYIHVQKPQTEEPHENGQRNHYSGA